MSSATEAAPASDRGKLPAPGTATLSRRQELRNLNSKVPEDQWPEFKARAIVCYHADSPALARMLRDDIAVTYGTALPSALTCLQDDFEACTAHCARYTPQTRLSSKARTGPFAVCGGNIVWQ